MKIRVDEKVIEIQEFEKGFLVDGELASPKISSEGKGVYHILHNNKNYRIEVFKKGMAYNVSVNGKRTIVEPASRVHEILEKIGINNLVVDLASDLRAPMPGKILKILASEKEAIEKSQGIIILEAMKMENILKAPVHGDISSISVKEGDTVEKDQILVTFENLK